MPIDPEIILNRARRYCSFQERCRKEVKDKLRDWKARQDDAEKIIKTLQEEGFLDEERFARLFISGKFRIKHWGRNKITFELKKRQVPGEIISSSFEEIDEEEYREALQQLLDTKSKALKEEDPLLRKKKLVSFAMQKGFEYPLIMELLS